VAPSIANFLWPFEHKKKINSTSLVVIIIFIRYFFSRAHNNCEETLTAFFTLCFEPIERQKLNKKNRLHCTVHIFCFVLILEFFFIFFCLHHHHHHFFFLLFLGCIILFFFFFSWGGGENFFFCAPMLSYTRAQYYSSFFSFYIFSYITHKMK